MGAIDYTTNLYHRSASYNLNVLWHRIAFSSPLLKKNEVFNINIKHIHNVLNKMYEIDQNINSAVIWIGLVLLFFPM